MPKKCNDRGSRHRLLLLSAYKQLVPANTDVYNGMGNVYYYRQSCEKALKAYDQAINGPAQIRLLLQQERRVSLARAQRRGRAGQRQGESARWRWG